MSIPASDGVAHVLHSALDGLSIRQRVIADNVANLDTPGFRASTVDFESPLKAAIASHSLDSRTPEVWTSPTGDPAGPDGNDVDLRQETMAAMQSLFQYRLISQATTDRYELVRTAAGTF